MTQAPSASPSPTLASLEKLIEITREQAKTPRQYPGRSRQDTEEQEGAPPSHTLDDLDLFIGRLRQVKDWLEQDPHLLHLVDRHVSQHVRRMEKRQSAQNIWLSVLTTLVGALLGWLTSALASPTTLWHLLFH